MSQFLRTLYVYTVIRYTLYNMRQTYSLLNMYRSLHISCTFVVFLLSFCDPQRVQVIYEGQNIVFYCNATGILNLAPVHYQWELDNRVIIASDDHFYLRNVQKSDEGEYKCKAIQIIDGESVVGVESTFISVRRADSIVEQDVEEGFLVRILCNVTEADRPEDAGPIRFEWRNPNGTLVGTQWKLELGHIRIHESGVYVCRVSYELDGKQMSTSSATKINVLKRAGIVFPGLIDHVLSVLETGDILQECKVISSKPSEYAYQWFRLNNQPISNSAYLQKDYVLRPRDEGIYTCVATPVDPGRSVVENNLVVTIIPLRFRIDVIDEDLKLDGFSRRRIVQIPPSDPSLNSRETFTFQWFKPDGAIVSQGPGPDMHVSFRSPEDFGRYFVRVRGANSGYHRDLSTYINLDDGIVAPTYTVVIREVSGPLYFNSRLELECATNPPNPSARINWLGPDGLIISDSSRLVFDRFQLHNQGRYTCQILLPNQVVLRQNVELTASGSGAEVPETGGRYTIAIVQTPLVFRYNDAVRLSCVVSPDPPFVQFEWMKDGHILGRDSELFIPNFGPRDVGRYLCKARIEGGEDLSSNTTISPRPTPPGSTYISVRPEELHQPTFSSFQIECISNRPGMLPVAQLPNGTPLETDDQFQVFRPDKERLTISAPRGLSGVYNGYRIRCVLPGLEYTEATLYIMDPCPLNESQCRSKECIPTMSLCDGRPHCRDASDEGNEFCNAGVIASPTKIIVRPNQSFTLKCHTQLTSERPYARFQLSEDNVELDRRFTAIQPATNVLFVTAPKGLTFKENDTRIECYIPGKGARVTIVNVLGDMCPPGWLLCRDGKCLSPANVCDGIPQCSDGADERQCAESCRPPNIACPSGECITPAMRCDGRRDCADNFDEQGCSPACSSLQFTCRSGECVASGSRCNGRRDCVDGSDEWGCSPECPPPNFQCPSGECVPPERRCDGQQDCQDGFDEQNCYIPVGCNPDQYACASGECVSIFLRCNGRPDCRDGSDEHSCVVGPSMYPDRVFVRPYASMEISCRSDRAGVQPIMIVGDGIPVERHPRFSVTRPNVETIVAHISGVTERDRGLQLRCSYQTGESTIREIIIDSPCQDFELMCRDGACMRQDRFCDGRTDCRDGSDEGPEHCGSGPALVPERPIVRPYGTLELECRSGRTGVQPQLTLLNGTSVEHLPRFTVTRPSTEVVFARLSPVTERDRGMRLSCSYPLGESTLIEILVDSPCPPSEVMCRDGSCVHEDYLCNGRSDCPDGSDEQDPHCSGMVPCPVGKFACSSGECINEALRCNERQDCYDGSDEFGCDMGPVLRPDRPIIRPYGSLDIECRSTKPGVSPQLTTYNGTSVESLPRFIVTRPNMETILAHIADLTEGDNGMRLVCSYPSGATTTTDIIIQSPCSPSEVMCRDGTCIRREYICNGRQDCPDGSDERDPHCRTQSACGPQEFLCTSGECIVNNKRCDGRNDCYDGSDESGCSRIRPIIRPERIVIPPYGSIEIECTSNQPGLRPDLRLYNGTLVEHLPNFQVTRPNVGTVIARSTSVTERERRMTIQCFFPTGETAESEIIIESPCRPSEMMCRDGTCIPREYFCDDQHDCLDGSDERPPHCIVRGPTINPTQPTVRPYGSVEIKCESQQFGIRPELRVANGTSVEELKRFQVDRPNIQTIIARLTDVTEDDRGLLLRCLYRTGESAEVAIGVDTPCGPGQRMCRNGQCVAQERFCDGHPDCSDGSDESPPRCHGSSRVEVLPGFISIRPYEPFNVECISHNPQIRPIARFASGRPVEGDPRFQLIQVTPSHLKIFATNGLTGREEDLTIVCIFPGIGNRTAVIDVQRPCPTGQYQCLDGRCIDANLFCNGVPDCPDQSDESEHFCYFDITVKPGHIFTRPFEMFQFECISNVRGQAPQVLFQGESVASDPRFLVRRPTTEHVIVQVPQGLPDKGGSIFQCVIASGEKKQILVHMDSTCPPTQYRCPGGGCIPTTSFCNGIPECPDRSDEDPRYCAVNLLLIPGYVSVEPFEPVEFVCESRVPGYRPLVTFADGRAIESDPRFNVTRPTPQRVVVRAEYGLSEDYHNTKFRCYTVSGSQREVLVQVESTCPAGQYRCRDGTCTARLQICDGRRDCPDGSDEDPAMCAVEVIVKPGTLTVMPNERFTYECISPRPNLTPQVTFDGYPVDQVPEFVVSRPSADRVIVTAERGLPRAGFHIFSCSVVTGTRKEVPVTVGTTCRSDQFSCRDGTCISIQSICNGVRDCPDGSDELPPQCPEPIVPVRIHFTPREIRVQPGRPIRLECHTDTLEAVPDVRFVDGRPISMDRRFVVTRPQANRIIIEIPRGLDMATREIRLECHLPGGDSKTATIYVDQSCLPGQRRCPGGDCIYVGQFCDGRSDCPDGFDERPENCRACDPIAKPCESVNGIPPTVTHFQQHWGCDGEDDCGNGYDELDCRNDTRNLDPRCGSTHFQCSSGSRQRIPFAYWCDGTPDCAGGEDEQECSRPAIIEVGRPEPYKVSSGSTLSLECEASGYPPPMIIWRFNWGCLPDASRSRTEVIPSGAGCRGSRSRLTVNNFRAGDDGIYNCEALLSGYRAMSHDYLVLLND